MKADVHVGETSGPVEKINEDGGPDEPADHDTTATLPHIRLMARSAARTDEKTRGRFRKYGLSVGKPAGQRPPGEYRISLSLAKKGTEW